MGHVLKGQRSLVLIRARSKRILFSYLRFLQPEVFTAAGESTLVRRGGRGFSSLILQIHLGSRTTQRRTLLARLCVALLKEAKVQRQLDKRMPLKVMSRIQEDSRDSSRPNRWLVIQGLRPFCSC